MFSSVQSAFRSFTEQFEGCVSFMYLDVKGSCPMPVEQAIHTTHRANGFISPLSAWPLYANVGGTGQPA